jgi:hypothetical protein
MKQQSDFLRRQAEVCLSISRATFDLTTAGRLRAMAEILRNRAAELDDETAEFHPHMIGRNGSPKGERDRD